MSENNGDLTERLRQGLLEEYYDESISLRAHIAELEQAEGRLASARKTTIEECAAICDKHAAWSEDKIEDDPASIRSQIFATISNTANDCASMIRDLKDITK